MGEARSEARHGGGNGHRAWMQHYKDMFGSDEVPIMGIRMLIGLDDTGKERFYCVMDGHPDNKTAVFMLDLAADTIREKARQAYKGHTTAVVVEP